MDRSAALKLLLAGLLFSGLFVALTAGGAWLVGSLLSDDAPEEPRSDFPREPARRPPEEGVFPFSSPEPEPARIEPPGTPDPEIEGLVALLASPDYGVRAKAESDLVARGESARGRLEVALGHSDPEVRWRAREALRRIDEGKR